MGEAMRRYAISPIIAGVVGGGAGMTLIQGFPTTIQLGGRSIPGFVGVGGAIAVGSALGHAVDQIVTETVLAKFVPMVAQRAVKFAVPLAISAGGAIMILKFSGNDFALSRSGVMSIALLAAASHMAGDSASSAFFGTGLALF